MLSALAVVLGAIAFVDAKAQDLVPPGQLVIERAVLPHNAFRGIAVAEQAATVAIGGASALAAGSAKDGEAPRFLPDSVLAQTSAQAAAVRVVPLKEGELAHVASGQAALQPGVFGSSFAAAIALPAAGVRAVDVGGTVSAGLAPLGAAMTAIGGIK